MTFEWQKRSINWRRVRIICYNFSSKTFLVHRHLDKIIATYSTHPLFSASTTRIQECKWFYNQLATLNWIWGLESFRKQKKAHWPSFGLDWQHFQGNGRNSNTWGATLLYNQWQIHVRRRWRNLSRQLQIEFALQNTWTCAIIAWKKKVLSTCQNCTWKSMQQPRVYFIANCCWSSSIARSHRRTLLLREAIRMSRCPFWPLLW